MSGATDAAAETTGTTGQSADGPGTEEEPAAGEPAVDGSDGAAEAGGTGQAGPTQGRTTVTEGQGARPPQQPQLPKASAPPALPPAIPAPARGEGAAGPVSGNQQPPAGYGRPQGVYDGQAAVRQPRPAARPVPRTRKARLRVSKADPWSVMKISFLLSIALGICAIVAVTVLWMVLDSIGVFSTVGGTIADATGSGSQNGFQLQSFLSLSHVVMFTALISVIDVVLATALATLGAFLYNLSAGFVGGVELTLAEDE